MAWPLFSSRPTAERREPTFAASASLENPSTSLSNPAAWLTGWAGMGDVDAVGPAVTEWTAMRVSTVHACVRLISGLIASLPLNVYRDQDDGGQDRVRDSVAARLLDRVIYPGRPMTAFTWRELVGTHLMLWGNAYAIIRYDLAGRVRGLEPVMPWRVTILRHQYRSWYQCQLEDGSTETIPHDEMLHFVGPSFEGLKGDARIAFAQEAIALARTFAQEAGHAHENATRPSGVVELPPSLTPEGAKRMKAQFDGSNTGRRNAGRVVYVDKDSKFTAVKMTPLELATLDERKLQAEIICQYFDVPPHLIDASDQTDWGTGVEQKTLAFLKFRFNKVLCCIEAELNAKLFADSVDYCEFNRDAMLAMDAKTSAEVAQIEIFSAQLLPNEARRRKRRPPVPGGDQPLINSTMIPLAKAGESRTPPAPAAGKQTNEA